MRNGYATRVLPKVYAIGHDAPSRESDLWAAVLYAGPGAMLSHATAAHRQHMLTHSPQVIEVSTPREKVESITGVVRVFCERRCARGAHDGIPVTPIPNTLLDLAATQDLRLVRRALAQLEFRGVLDVEAIEGVCGRGRAGSRALRRALATHQPKLAHANGALEEEFLMLCERWRLPLPRLNVRVHGILVDAHWPEHRLVVELDGRGNHSSPAQLRRDKHNDLVLRSHGLSVIRYDWSLVHDQPQSIRRDLMMHMSG